MYIHRLPASIAAAMGGLDALVFTGGVGQHAPKVRALTVEGLGFLGAQIDPTLNDGAVLDSEIGNSDSSVHILVIDAREDLQMVSEVR